METTFIPSQRAEPIASQGSGASQTQDSISYTSTPARLLFCDLKLTLLKWKHILGILRPFKPEPEDELYLSPLNVVAIVLHAFLIVWQLVFLAFLPFFVFLPVTWLLGYLAIVFGVNMSVCRYLNGTELKLESNKDIIKDKNAHSSEHWIFMNGVSVGSCWLQSNIDRLSKTFGRKVHGVHNPTAGIIFDLVQCLIQRNFTYSTEDVRQAYVSIKTALCDEKYKKVVFILHSQGGIEGGLIIDWLLAELPHSSLCKLEVYTFGNAANHFNNPNRGFFNSPEASNGTITTQEHYRNDRAISHIEHYTNIGDYVSQIGVLAFANIHRRFMGRIFTSPYSGHLLNQHYLHQMFPLDSEGRALDTNEFMEMNVNSPSSQNSDESPDSERESILGSLLEGFDDDVLNGASVEDVNSPLAVFSPLSPLAANRETRPMKVKHFSRLWRYRNGGVPKD